MRRLSVLLSSLLVTLIPAACASASDRPEDAPPLTPHELAHEAGVPLTRPPYEVVAVEWKERIVQPYVYFEHRGTPEEFGATMRGLLEHAVRKRVATNGPPFALYPSQGNARACLPVEANPNERGLPFDILPKAMVAYAVVSGPYPDAPRALPGLRDAMATKGWSERGPVRAIYLVNPAEVPTYGSLATELQIPWAVSP